jgi:hypothetical protein
LGFTWKHRRIALSIIFNGAPIELGATRYDQNTKGN